MSYSLPLLLKPEYRQSEKLNAEIPDFMNPAYLSGDNEKYMKMYNWMSRGYDIVETIVGNLKYGDAIQRMRTALMAKLEWKNGLSVLYVSIGTGKDLKYLPASIDKNSLNICGADISLGMLKQCRRNFKHRLHLSLLQCCAEDLPFADEVFDIVYHVGGINFFNDRPKAVQEMIRVAKKGSKLLIADETNDLIEQQYRKSGFSRKYFKDVTVDLSDIERCIPESVREKEAELLWDGKFYCITFRK